MRKSPASCELFAADESFSPAQMERDLLRGERGEPWPFCGAGAPPAMKEACAVVLAVAGRFVE